MNLIIEVRAKSEKFNEFYQTVQAILPALRKENGCRESRIYRDVEDGEVFSLEIRWENRASMGKYIRSTGGSALLGAVDLLSDSVRIKIGNDAAWDGIDVLKRMRKGEQAQGSN